jgi:hypothetical protein
MKSPLLTTLVLGLLLTSCEKPAPPPAAITPPAPPADDSALREARDALARQAMDIETRSALLDKQLADLEARLKQSENEALRGQLDLLKQQNDQLRTQADSARKQSDALTQRLTTSAPAPAPTTPKDLSIFYERLAPHGRWIDVSGHGPCFQPRLARNRSWRPYVDGSWNWSSLGWTWQTSEPFGWATYHYGRWVNLTTHGWLWVPGCEWAPAWVAWRQSRDHIGWAPLPPESSACDTIRRDCDTRYRLGPASYTFVRTTHFVRPSYSTCIQPVSYNSTLFQHTVNITQIVPCGGNSAGTPMYMHHGGPPRQHIEQACQQPVPQAQIRPIEPAQITLKTGPLDTSKGITPIVGIIQLPSAAENKLPTIQPAERIERPILANPYAGVPAMARAGIQQTLEAEVRQVQLADSPRPLTATTALETPATLGEAIASTPVAPTSPPALLQAPPANPSALTETRGGQPESILPALTPTTAEPPALVGSTAPMPSEPSTAAESSTPPQPPVLIASAPFTAPQPLTPTSMPSDSSDKSDPSDLSVASQPAATTNLPPTAPTPAAATTTAPQVDETTRAAAEQEAARQAQMQAQQQAAQQQAQMEAQKQAEETARQQAETTAMAQRQAEEEAARRAAEEAQRQAQMEAQRQAEEAARRAAEEAQRQAQMEAQRQAEEAARRAAEEAQRQAQMEAQRQAEEAARRAAEEAQRQAQMEAQRQAEEAARRAAEEAARQAAQQPSPPPQ